MTILIPALLWVALVALAVRAYREAKAAEAADAARTAEFDAAMTQLLGNCRRIDQMDRAMTDDRGVCWVCTAPAKVLELVDHAGRFDLCCLDCAAVLKPRREGIA